MEAGKLRINCCKALAKVKTKNKTKSWDGKVQTVPRCAVTIVFLTLQRKQVSQIWQIVGNSTGQYYLP
jgi:hypothetical protein